MAKTWRTALLAVILAGAGLAAPAQAQLSSGRGPISYSADNLEYRDDQRELVLIGNVEITQNDATLRANRLTLVFSPRAAGGPTTSASAGDIERIIAEGDVFYIRCGPAQGCNPPQQVARGQRAIYETRSDTVTFTGNVVISSSENIIRGDTLVLNISEGRTVLKPSGKPGERVRGVFSTRPDAGEKPPASQP